MRRLSVALLASLVVAGCLGGAAPPDDAAGNASVVDGSRPEPTFNDLTTEQLGSAAAPDADASLATAPALREGEWWRIEMHDLFLDETTEFVRVVARVEPDLYVFGMPHAGWWKEAIIYHAPAFGDVGLDLSHRAHDLPFEPLRFPLEDGATWETAWETPDPVTATVAVESGTTARVTFTGTQCGAFALVGQCPTPQQGTIAEVVYDASIHEISEASFPSHTWRVVEHGYGYTGWVTVPRAEHLVFLHGRVGTPAIDVVNPGPALPTDTVEVEGGFNRVSFILVAGNAVGSAGGAYSEKATAPDGTVFELRQVPGGALAVAFFEHPDPDGTWQLEHLAAGPGFVFTEGIAYHQYDIELPTGRIRSDHSHEVVR
ncbi:MAG TPA: hypothetical protein VI997_11925 [Candidatus Thermoplasmatota archaeon]|nr:hypothetical protein [Candidatus Thermoplasmatota archaeon]